MSIPSAFLQELLARADLVEVIGRHVALRKSGANYLGLCPFHAEKSPSFTVSPAKQFYHCFGCGAHGNAIDFLMAHTGAGFREAVHDLAAQLGLTVPEDERSPAERAREAAQRQQQASLTDVLARAAQAYRAQLKAAPRAIDYLKGRGLTGQIAKTFGLGYAPPGWRFLSTVFPDYQDARLVEAGLVVASDEDTADGAASQRRHDRFRDRIMFPIRNVKGEVIGFGGRVIDGGEPKYLNSPETALFHKGEELYGLYEARSAIRQAGCALVVEGYMDVVALAQWGLGHAVATLGTACTPDHVRKLLRFTDDVVFAFDGDAAGRRAAQRALAAALPWATDTRRFRFLLLPPEHDPDSYIRAHGAEAFAAALAQATPLSRFVLEVAAEGCDLATAEGRARATAQAQPLWQALPDGALKRQLLHELAELAALEVRDLQQLWHTDARSGRAAAPSARSARSARSAPAATAPPTHRAHADAIAPGAATAATAEVPAAAPPRGRWPARADAATLQARRAARGLLGRADRIARIVLTTPQAWDWLTADDHALLAAEPPPHGPLFAWLEGQWLEHGAQPWAALREALRGQPFEALALALHDSGLGLERVDANAPEVASADHEELRRELRELLRRMRIEALKQLETDLIGRAATDPAALARYRDVVHERRRLQNEDEPV
ncbi:MAG: DNA primase [Pseudomonadota bacterium]|uniref:DNA primase n=1 Tax=Tepidimonas thermarum TaxID=335431 RepID=UPI0011804F4F|nr:DNA primase [Tepidimonas thermarum]